jgi:hypothetical protein
MRSRNLCFVYLAALGMTLGLPASALAAPFAPNFVQQHDRTITVLPTGVDDTANLQSAFDNAVAAGPGVKVQLVAGIYHTREIAVNNFRGTFTGAGAEKSVLTNLPNLVVKQPSDYFNTLPTPSTGANPWPTLVAFVDGDFVVSDMGMNITGAKPTTGWLLPPTVYEMAVGFAVVGTEAKATFLRVSVVGEPEQNSLFGYNLINGIYFEGHGFGAVASPISGSFTVRDSVFQHEASTTPIASVVHASILISGNHYQDVFDAMEVAGLLESRYTFSLNTVEGAVYGGLAFDLPVAAVSQVTSSEILVSNNVFSGDQYGVYLDATFAGGATCQVVSNTFQNIANIGIYLGPNTSHCTVAGNSKTTIQNLGTNNVIVP